jgi:hypothetical protein
LQVRFLHGALSFGSGLSGIDAVSEGLTTLFPEVNKITSPGSTRTPWPEFEEEPQLASPGSIDPEMIQWYSEAVAK